MTQFLRALPLAPRPAPARLAGARLRWRQLWFPSLPTGVFSLLLAAALLVAGWHFLQWAVLHAHWRGTSSEACVGSDGACWAFVLARWKTWIVGPYPDAQLWRPWVGFALFAGFWAWAVRRPASASPGPVLWGFVLLPCLLLLLLAGGGPLPAVPATQWGGLLLTLAATLVTFVTALPLGLLLALGRRSRLPVLRWLCAGFVEGMRSVPLLAVLFVAATLLPMFLPPGWNLDLFTRALVAFALFNAAMAAEVFRGGLQTVGAGQLEAAATVGLGDFATLRLVVLPQAVRAVVPALVNILIAIVKETTLLSVIGLSDLLGAIENGAKSPEWSGEANILTSGQVFLALVYLAVCYGLSRYSRRLETHDGHPAR
ncbi:amino acid ABC transporter permease [Ramlibacter alkalitolerans]|uniref:Amino acid ABC transporter permease n=1 Tax=Ramlibacter alkalitolerans TaxID=2039631 RepID=A0ABS1JSS9_9BURK|nr:amino acid ABC transporter permease [Ramlibacter alkalitolerans]MBL0427196.1 amino acid ABC transporter permease [Ramlibacter alkalitolerans]